MLLILSLLISFISIAAIFVYDRLNSKLDNYEKVFPRYNLVKGREFMYKEFETSGKNRSNFTDTSVILFMLFPFVNLAVLIMICINMTDVVYGARVYGLSLKDLILLKVGDFLLVKNLHPLIVTRSV